MTFAQVVADAPLSLNTVIDGFAAVVAVFILRAVMDSRDKVRAIWTALYGESSVHPPNGALRKLNSISDTLDAHCATFERHVASDERWREEARTLANTRNGALQASLTKIDTRLGAVEDKLSKPRSTPR